jgi:hypothetical protein
MKTAIEWLVDEHFGGIENCTPDFRNKIEHAKEMEEDQKKELVIATYTYLKMKDCQLPYGIKYLNKISELDDEAEQYYNETFKQEQ